MWIDGRFLTLTGMLLYDHAQDNVNGGGGNPEPMKIMLANTQMWQKAETDFRNMAEDHGWRMLGNIQRVGLSGSEGEWIDVSETVKKQAIESYEGLVGMGELDNPEELEKATDPQRGGPSFEFQGEMLVEAIYKSDNVFQDLQELGLVEPGESDPVYSILDMVLLGVLV